LAAPARPPPPAASAPPEPTAQAIVANGKTVHVPTGELEFAGYGRDGKEVTRSKFKVFRPGQEVTLSASEVKRLRRDGFLVDPDRVIVAPSGGGLRRSVAASATGDREPPAAA
jgi:hypothetical protein